MYFRKLRFEALSSREMLTSNLHVAAETSPLSDSFALEAEAHDDSILITNESTELAQFTMRFNGNLSVNTQDLVQQIREFEVAGQPDMPDYEKVYHYMLKYHAHDWAVTDKFYMHEPSLYVNSFGVGLCGDVAGAMKLIWNEMGYEARLWYLNGHVVSEVFAEERWQMYDADLRVVYYNHETGEVAGVEELAANPHFIYSPLVRFDNANGTGVNHSKRTASFYSTTENNWICLRCTEHVQERDLIFQIPAGGSLRVGELTPERSFPNRDIDVSNLGVLTVTIPKNSSGSLDIPLALYDVTGNQSDNVTIGSRTISLGSDDAFEYFNNERGSFEQPGQRLETISYSNNSQPIHIHYLVNRKLTEVLDKNLIEIHHIAEPTTLTVDLVGPSDSVTWTDKLVADVNGDGKDDVVGRVNGQWWVAIGDGSSFSNASNWGSSSNAVTWVDVQVGDVNGDGMDDIVGRTNGQWWVARSTGSSFVSEFWGQWSSSVTWVDVHVADVDGDGKDDIVGRTSGQWWVSHSQGSYFTVEYWGRWSNAVTWVDVLIADVNGDGKEDVVGRTSGSWWVSRSTGTEFIVEYWGAWSNAVAWSDVQTIDVDGDNMHDVAGRTPAGEWWVMHSDGSSFAIEYWGSSGPGSWMNVDAGNLRGTLGPPPPVTSVTSSENSTERNTDPLSGSHDKIVGYENRLAGDIEDDGHVGFTDFLKLSANFGSTNAVWEHGDLDGNGEVEFADFLILSANFGNTRSQPRRS